jgi:glutamyl-tRNA synthetase
MVADARLPAICALLKDRCDTTMVLADWAAAFYADVQIKPEDLVQYVTDAVKPALQTLAEKLNTCAWDKAAIAVAIKEVLTAHSLKMPQLAMPVRVLLMGTPQTPSLDAIIALFSKQEVLRRLQTA